ncbi:MAG TPA: S9 family peptidase, partial [Bacteroidia bacterium]|nr:S9 family peptidase [Bacteroidia bacterium]
MKQFIYLLLIIQCHHGLLAQSLNYPATKKINQVDTYFESNIEDPYRWLEDDNSIETASWVKMQNEVTFNYLEEIPFRKKVKTRLTALWNYPRHSAPFWSNGFYYFYKNNGIQNQSVLYRRSGLKGKEEMILDPNFLSTDGTTSIRFFSLSNDGKYAAYGLSKAGSDWTEIKIMECATGRDLAET